MFAATQVGRITYRAIFLTLSALVVSAFLSLGAYAAESAECVGYTVTVTQLS